MLAIGVQSFISIEVAGHFLRVIDGLISLDLLLVVLEGLGLRKANELLEVFVAFILALDEELLGLVSLVLQGLSDVILRGNLIVLLKATLLIDKFAV